MEHNYMLGYGTQYMLGHETQKYIRHGTQCTVPQNFKLRPKR